MNGPWWRDMIHAHGQSKPWQGYLNTSEPQFQSDCCWAGSSVESEQGCSISIHPFPLSSSKYPPKHPSARAFICNTCLQTTFGKLHLHTQHMKYNIYNYNVYIYYIYINFYCAILSANMFETQTTMQMLGPYSDWIYLKFKELMHSMDTS